MFINLFNQDVNSVGSSDRKKDKISGIVVNKVPQILYSWSRFSVEKNNKLDCNRTSKELELLWWKIPNKFSNLVWVHARLNSDDPVTVTSLNKLIMLHKRN